MIAEVLKDDFYSLEEMAEILLSKNPRLKTAESRRTALLRRKQTRTEIPPFTEIEGEILFPRSAFRDWALKRPLLHEVKRVG